MIKQLTLAATGTALTLLLIGGNASGITVNLDAAKDNTLYEDPDGTLSNGAGPGLFAGVTGQDRITRGLLMFDVAAEIPASATITGATLSLYASTPSNDFPDTISLYRVASDWGEGGSVGANGGGGGATAQPGDATWIHRFSPSQLWTNPGGDFTDVLSASRTVGAAETAYLWNSEQLTDDVQDMFYSPNANFGWIVRGNESASRSAKRFGSRESSNPPVLTIEYDLPPGFDADFDGDGDVDGDDLDDWQDAFGSGNNGDADADGDSDGADFLIWQQEFTGPAGLQTATVPEPSAAALALTLLALATPNRRSNALRGQISR